MSALQVLVCIFALSMAYLSYLSFRRGQFGAAGLVLWEAIWLGLVVVSLAPQLFRTLIQPLHVARLMDLVIVVGMLALAVITYRNFVLVQQLRRQLEQTVREQALEELGIATLEAPQTAHPAGREPELARE